MSIYSDRFIPIRTFSVNKMDISEFTQWDSLELCSYKIELRKTLFGSDITQKTVLHLRKRIHPAALMNLFSSPQKQPNLPRLSQNPEIGNELDTKENNFDQSNRIGVDYDHKFFFLRDRATYVKNLKTDSIETINGSFQSFAAIPNRSACALSSTAGKVLLFDTHTLTPQTVYDGTVQLSCMAAQSPNALFIGSIEGTLKLIDFRQQMPAASFEIGTNAITGISLNNSMMLALGSENDQVLLRDLRKSKHFQNLPSSSITHGKTVSFSPIHPELLAAAEKNTVKIWDVTNTSIETIEINLHTSQSWDPPETDVPFKDTATQKEITTLCWDLDRKGFKLTQLINPDLRSTASDELHTKLAYFTQRNKDRSWILTDTLDLIQDVFFHALYDKGRTFYLSTNIIFLIQDIPKSVTQYKSV